MARVGGENPRLLKDQRVPISIVLLEAATRGDVNALARLLSQEDHLTILVDEGTKETRGGAADSGPRAANKESTVFQRARTTWRDRRLLFGVTNQGNTALHVAASLGHADFIMEILRREGSLLVATNSRGDTPLHCAARAGHHEIASQMLRLARDGAAACDMAGLARARNRDGETALHAAARGGYVQVAQKLVEADKELASIVNNAGVSPLYLAVMAHSVGVVQALLQSSSGEMASYAGPSGRTALHAAVIYSIEISELLLQWKPKLVREADVSKCAPLHYVASSGDSKMADLLLRHDVSTAYLHDQDGLTPIHVAAHMGRVSVISTLIQHCPDLDEQLDGEGKTFLHAAAEANRDNVIRYVLKRSNLVRLINYQDFNGSTTLHVAVAKGNAKVVYQLVSDKRVQLSIMNNEGSTPLDISIAKAVPGQYSLRNAQVCITRYLSDCGALLSPRTEYHDWHTANMLDQEHETKKQLSKAKNRSIAAVLISTVTFAAAFTMPGGFRGDDGPHGGMAILAGSYAFKAFLISDTFAMVLSFMATFHFIMAGSIDLEWRNRAHRLRSALRLLWGSFILMSIAFGMGVYAAMPSESLRTSVIVCFIVFMALFITSLRAWWPIIYSTMAVVSRMGILQGLLRVHSLSYYTGRRAGLATASLRSLIINLFRSLVIVLSVFLLAKI